MSKNIKTRKGKDGFNYPYTSPDLVIDSTGESQTTKNNNMKTDIQTLKDNEVTLVKDETSMEGIKDNEYPTLTTQDKTLIGSINELNSQFKDIANNTTDWINVTKLGIDNSGETDVADKLQKIINDSKGGTVLFFPSGVYRLSHGIDIKKISIIGNPTGSYSYNENTNAYTCLILDSEIENVDILYTSNRNDRVVIKDIMIKSNSCVFSKNSDTFIENTPKNEFDLTISKQNVNGLNLSKSANIFVENVYITGCSGYGIDTGAINYLNNVIATNCNIGFKVNKDGRITNPYSSGNSIGFEIYGSNNNINNIWCDQIIKYGIYINSENNVDNLLVTGNLDQIGYCGVYNNANLNNSKFDMIMGRVSQYYAGITYNNTPESDRDKNCAFYNQKKIYGCNINCQINYAPGNDTGTRGKCPSVKFINNGVMERSYFVSPSCGEKNYDSDFMLIKNLGSVIISTISNSNYNYIYDFSGNACSVNVTMVGKGAPTHSGFLGNFYFDETEKSLYLNLYGGTTWTKLFTVNS